MRRRIALRWLPLALFVLLATTGVLLCAAESSGPGVLLVGTLDGYQLGMLLIVLATGTAVVALIQAAVLAGALKRPAWCLLIRLVAGLLIAVAVPFGHLLIVVAAFSAVNTYEPLAVRGHHVVLRTFTWHHRSFDLLEQDGALYEPVALCGDPLPVDGYDAFSAGRYDLVSRGGRDVIRFAEGPVGPYTGAAVLGARPGDDVTGSCGAR
ncbi:hypothetical protein [uncultured Leifsonia sp.]|uniref:hypothetical protein n=1 Tax=uncultured Leifsonia sp. TaxID=340359 RepID=UPI0025F3CB6E|nr:hypothetical protein [uncultured Leifsonia sp.]